MSKLDFNFKHTLRVRWKECDIQGIAYYGSYIDFIDVAQAEYFRNLGILTHQADSLVNVFNTRIENAKARRGDAKGIVEQRFRTFLQFYVSIVCAKT